MICRVVTLVEENHGEPIMTRTGVDENGMPIYTQTGWKNPWYIPALSNFPGAWKVDYADGKTYAVYGPAKNRQHWHWFILWRQAPGLYLAFGAQEKIQALAGTAPLLTAYSKLPTHYWRTYQCAGTDSALGPNGQPIGAFSGRVVTFTEQPPVAVTVGKPYIVGTMTITSIVAVPASSCGPIDTVECAKRVADEQDRPGEKQLATTINGTR